MDLAAFMLTMNIEGGSAALPPPSARLQAPRIDDSLDVLGMSAFALLEADSQALWRRARSPGSADADRCGSLAILAQRQDPAVPRFLVEELERPQLPRPAFHQALLAVAERHPIVDAGLRSRLTRALGALLATLEPPALLSVVRGFATLAPACEGDQLLPLLVSERDILVRQTALQAIQTLYSVDPPEPGKPLERLQSAVRALLDGVLRDEELRLHIPAASLALSGLHAAALLDDGDTARGAAARLVARGLSAPIDLLITPLRRALQGWEAEGRADRTPAARLRALLVQLEERKVDASDRG